jgi:hypothetical protein
MRTIRACVEHTNFNLSHHVKFWEQVEKLLPLGSLENNGELGKIWENATSPYKIKLDVPYYSQVDSATSQSRRMCFASSSAMLASFILPNCLRGKGQPDDQFLKIVNKFGDTTDANSQILALKYLGINAVFRKDGYLESLIGSLKQRVPIVVGWLHHGHVSRPSGGGHMSIVTGWDGDSDQLIFNDPFGEADLVNGGYLSTAVGAGRAVRYSIKNWSPRWMVEGNGSGWWIEVKK